MIRFRRPRSPVHTLRRAAAVILAVGAVVLAVRPAEPGAHAVAAPPGVAVVVAAHDLAPGSVLTAADLRSALFPATLVPRGSSSAPARLTGRALAAGVRSGEPVTDVRIVGAGLTAQLSPGQVAAPVRLADLTITALIRAGDRVDVLASLPDAPRAEVLAPAALVLAATGTGRDAGAADGAAGGLLLLAVDAPTAARLAAAATTATLTVTLSPAGPPAG